MNADVLPQSDYFNWSLNQLSREFGIARETVAKRLNDADVQPSGTKRGHPVYSVKSAATAILLYQHTGVAGLSNPELMAPSDRRHWYASERDRTTLEKEQGLLVAVDDCREQIVKVALIASNVLEVLIDEIERDFDLPQEVVLALEEKLQDTRTVLANEIEMAD
jgi:hypothetical protein